MKKKLITIIVSSLILAGCQASLINQNKSTPKLTSVAYHNQYVEQVNNIIADAEVTIKHYKDSFKKQADIASIEQALNNLKDQIKISEKTLDNRTTNNKEFDRYYQKTFKVDYLTSIKDYLNSYENWLIEMQEISQKTGPITTESDTLEQNYSQYIQSHNYFVKQINEHI